MLALFVIFICCTILGFISIQPAANGDIFFLFPYDLFAGFFSSFISMLKDIIIDYFNVIILFFRTFPDRFNVNLLGFIWDLLRDSFYLLLTSCLVFGIIGFIPCIILVILDSPDLKNEFNRKNLPKNIFKLLISIFIGLIIGSIIGIIIKPYFKELSWIGFGISILVILAGGRIVGFIDDDGFIHF